MNFAIVQHFQNLLLAETQWEMRTYRVSQMEKIGHQMVQLFQ